jgi:hypothetical protein
LQDLTERYCVILQTLQNPPAFDIRFDIAATPKARRSRMNGPAMS